MKRQEVRGPWVCLFIVLLLNLGGCSLFTPSPWTESKLVIKKDANGNVIESEFVRTLKGFSNDREDSGTWAESDQIARESTASGLYDSVSNDNGLSGDKPLTAGSVDDFPFAGDSLSGAVQDPKSPQYDPNKWDKKFVIKNQSGQDLKVGLSTQEGLKRIRSGESMIFQTNLYELEIFAYSSDGELFKSKNTHFNKEGKKIIHSDGKLYDKVFTIYP